jgi:hypothetical protein
MNYDLECRKATRRKINVVLPCIVIRAERDKRARVPSEKACPARRPTAQSVECVVGAGEAAAFKERGGCNNYFNSELH